MKAGTKEVFHQSSLNESPSQKEGKSFNGAAALAFVNASMKVPPKRKGNADNRVTNLTGKGASMKVPPKRKGNHPVGGERTGVSKPQ